MHSIRSSAFFTASVAAHLAVAALLFRSPSPEIAEAPAAKALTGETLSLPEEDVATEGVEAPSALSPDPSPEAPEMPGPSPHAVRVLPHSRSNAKTNTNAAGSSHETGSFGAVGERASSDILSAFTKAFPQAASADPVWLSVPFGKLGALGDVELEIDASGAFVTARIGEYTPPALRRGIERTVALIRSRTFTAHAAVTRVFIAAKVSPDEVHDGLHGDVFAIGGSFQGERGNAFFALAAGRRIDLSVVGK